MIYDKIDVSKLSLGKPQEFNNDGKYIVPIFYDGKELNFSLKNKYVTFTKIEKNIFEKKFVAIKSEEYEKIVTAIASKLDCAVPTLGDGSFRATINNKTKFDKEVNENDAFDACVALKFPTIFKDGSKNTLQINLSEVVVTQIFKSELEVDFDKLEKAM